MTQLKIHRFVASDIGVLLLLASARVLLHVFTNGRYGFHRDELLTLDNARYLAWGYVVYPPVTPFLARVELAFFGDSLTGFRFFPALSQGLVMLLTGLSARALGASRAAQVVAALSVAVSGHALVSGWFLSYSTFDYLWWPLVASFVIRLLKSEDPRWWVAIGLGIAAGMLTKYTMGFLALGVVGGTLLTPTRRYLKTAWPWIGVVLALLVMLPHFVWQFHNHFVTFSFLKAIHARDIRWGWTDYFLLNQLWKSTNPVTVPLWLAGLWYLFVRPDGKRYRMLGWMYAFSLVALFLARGRDYYLAGAYPMLFAAGAVCSEKWLHTRDESRKLAVRATVASTLAISFLCTAAVTLPVAPRYSRWFRFADQVNGGSFGYQLGWPELADATALARDSLPPNEQARLGILAQD